MSERINCDTFVPSEELASEWSLEIIAGLKWAIGAFDEPMKWRAKDGSSVIEAEPPYFSIEEKEPVPYGKLREMPAFRVMENLWLWNIKRTTVDFDAGAVQVGYHIVHPKRAVVGTALGSLAVFEDSAQGQFARNAINDDMKRALESPVAATIRDYANLLNHMYDLEEIAEQKHEEYMQYLANMTKEDMRNHRAMQREWIIGSEPDKAASPKWWGITNWNQVWLVKASSPEEAVLDLEDHFEMGLETLMLVFTDPYDDKVQADLAERYPDDKIRRLIPFSIVEWPDDAENMTTEQKAAFDRLKRD